MSSRGATGDLFKKKFGWKCKLFFSRPFLHWPVPVPPVRFETPVPAVPVPPVLVTRFFIGTVLSMLKNK